MAESKPEGDKRTSNTSDTKGSKEKGIDSETARRVRVRAVLKLNTRPNQDSDPKQVATELSTAEELGGLAH